jgi:uncharacterized spore protein YtfJ
MKVTEVFHAAKDAITVKRVFAEPYEKDGVTVIPAATLWGGAGGGSGQDDKGQEGGGGGFGMSGRPAGAYVIKDGKVSWRPAVDPNLIIAVVGGAVIAHMGEMRLLSAPSIIRSTENLVVTMARSGHVCAKT